MKNANIFVDVDLTLVDANGKLLDRAREALLAPGAGPTYVIATRLLTLSRTLAGILSR